MEVSPPTHRLVRGSKRDRVAIFLIVWGVWALAVTAWVWYRVVTVDHVSPGLALGLALVFGLLTYDGGFLVHLPVIAAIGWGLSSGLVDSKLGRLGGVVGLLLKAGLTAAWLAAGTWVMQHGSDPP